MKRTWLTTTTLCLLTAGVAPAQGTGAAPAPPARRSILGRITGNTPAPPPAAPRVVPTPGGPAPRDPAVRAASGGTGAAPAAPGATSAPAPDDTPVFRTGQEIPAPAAMDELEAPRIALPTGPIEPYLLQKQNGPFMVCAYTFRGPDAARYAQALAIELRNTHRLPAYVWYLRIQPGHSNIRNVPPTAPAPVRGGETVQAPEKYRSYDEAAVLVGDCKTIDESEDLLHRVKKVRSAVVDGLPSIWTWRKGKGLSRATLTTNPLVPNQSLFTAQDRMPAGRAPGAPPAPVLAAGTAVDPSVLTASFQPVRKPDPLVKQMNSGPRSAFQCPGPYTLQVAEFLGRSTVDPNDQRLTNDSFLKQGPLAAAADEAERLAESLTKLKSLDRRYQPYVFHDRTSSRVYLGSFQGPNDPGLKDLASKLNAVSTELLERKMTQLPLAPSGQLTPAPRP
jgi:hypothetical protein